MRQRVWGILAGLYIGLCLLLGGASAAGFLANALLQTFGLLAILAVLWAGRGANIAEARPLAWIVGLFVLLVIVSLVPLPFDLWAGLPYRGEIAEALGRLGIDSGAMTLSLAPRATIASALGLLPPIAVFLLVIGLRGDARRWMAGVVLALTVASVSLGIFQLLGGPNSPLRFYEITNESSPVGFFANVNHQATLILAAIPLAAALAARMAMRSDRSRRTGGIVLSVATILFLLVGIGLAGSMAGYGLVLPSAFAALLIYRRGIAGRITRGWRIALAVILLVFVGGALAGPLSQETLSGKFSDYPSSRATIAQTTVDAAMRAFPLGTGLGSFQPVYRRFEDPARASNEYVNHAHNDYLEVLLELGLPGMMLILAFILWWAIRSVRVWRDDFSGAALARAGSVIVGIILLHSLVDYPLRTAAIAALLGLACALMMPTRSERRDPESTDPGRERVRHVSA